MSITHLTDFIADTGTVTNLTVTNLTVTGLTNILTLNHTAWAGPAANISLTGNWGDNPTLSVTSGSNDMRGRVTITSDVNFGASPGWQLTYSGGVWAAAPFVLVYHAQSSTQSHTVTRGTSNFAVVQPGTIGSGVTFIYDYMVMG